MKEQKITKQKNELKNLIALTIKSGILFAGLLLAGCASNEKRDTAVRSVLEKENDLIAKLKNERANPEVAAEFGKSEILKKLEIQLSASLDEITKANSILQEQLKEPVNPETQDPFYWQVNYDRR